MTFPFQVIVGLEVMPVTTWGTWFPEGAAYVGTGKKKASLPDFETYDSVMIGGA